MPITHRPGGSTIVTGDSISFLRLASLRGAVYLETKGIKVRRGPCVWRAVKQEFNIPGTRLDVLAWLDAKLDELRPLQEHIAEDGTRLVDGMEVQ